MKHYPPETISTSRNPTKVLRCSGCESTTQSSITSLIRTSASSIVFSKSMAAFELGAGYDEDPILICFDNDGNMNRFHIHIIGIHALILFCSNGQAHRNRAAMCRNHAGVISNILPSFFQKGSIHRTESMTGTSYYAGTCRNHAGMPGGLPFKG